MLTVRTDRDTLASIAAVDDLSLAGTEEDLRDRVLDDPEPVVAVSSLGDSAVVLMVRPWCRTTDYWPLKRDLTRRLKEELEAAGCELPYPQRDVHLHGSAPSQGAA